MDRTGRALTVEVVDTGGAGPAPDVTGAGRGLAGLAEAVTTAGGSMTWGAREGGGFRVAARIPEVGA